MRSSGKLFSAGIFGSARSTNSLKDGWFACSFCPLWFVRRLRRQFVVRLSTVQWECDIGWCGGRYLRRAWMPLSIGLQQVQKPNCSAAHIGCKNAAVRLNGPLVELLVTNLAATVRTKIPKSAKNRSNGLSVDEEAAGRFIRCQS